MNANEIVIADTYAAWFAARTDCYSSFRGGTWICIKEPLTAAVIAAGFAGGPSVSGYTINPDNRTHVGCIDFDSADGLALARQVRAAMAAKDVTGYVETSREGRAHLWVLSDEEMPARTIRRALMAFLGGCGLSWAPDNPKIELRPAQDKIKPDGYGSPIRMPTMPNHKTGRRYPMLGPDDRPLSPRLDEMLLAIDFSPSWVFAAMADTLRPKPSDLCADYFPPRMIRHDQPESVCGVLMEVWGVQRAVPGHTTKCPAHGDAVPSLSISADDQRVWCKSPACDFYNDGHGRGPAELRKLATSR